MDKGKDSLAQEGQVGEDAEARDILEWDLSRGDGVIACPICRPCRAVFAYFGCQAIWTMAAAREPMTLHTLYAVVHIF